MPQELTPEDEKRLKGLANTGGYVPVKMPEISPEKQVQPGFFSRLGSSLIGPIESLGLANPESLATTLEGMDESREATEKAGGSRLRSELAGSPVAPISEDIYNKNWEGLGGTGAGMLLGGLLYGTPEGRGAVSGAFREGFKGTPIRIPWSGGRTVNVPQFVEGAAAGGGAGLIPHYLFDIPKTETTIPGAAIGGLIPFVKGGYEGAMEAYRARPWTGPKGIEGETRTPYVPPKQGSSEYRNPPSGSVVSGNTYGTPTDEPSPLDKLSSSYREQLRRQGPPRPDLPPSTSGTINLQKMIQATKDMLKRRGQD